MRKKIIFAIILLCTVFIFSSCDGAGELPTAIGPVELNDREIKDITALLSIEREELGAYTVECYGKWDGVCVFRYYKGSDTSKTRVEIVDGYFFSFPQDSHLFVAAEGKLYTIYDAYKKDILSLAQVSAVHALCHPLEVVTEPPVDLLNTPPTSTGPVVLNDDELIMIAKTIMACDESASKRMAYYRIECYAKADGVYVGFLDEPGLMYAQALTSCTVGGFKFDYSSSRQMKVCDGKGVYSMTEAYERGILSDSLLEAAYKAYTKSE